jgi:hypothetical protein
MNKQFLSNIYEGSTAVEEHKDKDKADGLEIAKSFILGGHQAYKLTRPTSRTLPYLFT